MINIQDKVKSGDFHLFIFSKDASVDAIQKIAGKYTQLLSVETILFTSGTGDLYNRLGIVNNGCYLVRPDQYIAYRSVKPDAGHFETYLQQFIIRQ